MAHSWTNIIDKVCWILLIPTAAYVIYRSFDRSESRRTLLIKLLVSGPLVGIILFIQHYESSIQFLVAAKPFFLIGPCMVLGLIWAPDIALIIFRPILSAFDGGVAEGEAKPFYFIAEGKRRKGLYHEAIAEARKQLEKFPGDYEGYMKVASIQMENLHDLSAAQATIDEFLALPDRPTGQIVSAIHLLADWQLQFGKDAPAAAESLRRIIQLFPQSALAHAAGQRIAHLGAADETRRTRDESVFTVKAGPRHIGLRQEPLPVAMAQDPLVRVEELVKQLESHPQDTHSRENLALIYAEEFHRVDLAADQLEQLIALPTEPPKHVARWLDLLATLHIKFAQNVVAAEVALRRIGEKFPDGALAAMAARRLATLHAELKAGQFVPTKQMGHYEKDLGLKRSEGGQMPHVSILIFLLTAVAAGAANYFPPVSQLPSRPNAPDPLVSLDGAPITTKKEWIKKRRPELKNLFQHYEYGWLPPSVKVTGKTTYADRNFFNGKATLQLVTLRLGKTPAPEVQLLMVIPNHRVRPVPIFIGMNFSGNHTLLADTNIPIPTAWMPTNIPHVKIINHRATEEGRGKQSETWALEQSIDRGYAVATYYCGDVELDKPNAEGGVRELVHAPRAADDWGTIAAWAWGMQRVMDYVAKDRDIDARRMALVGHSRFGKATILAGAFDERAALVIPLQAGCGGTAPSRGTNGESVKQINDRFPEWFCGTFKQFNGAADLLPFDQNCLIALCAPRPVLLGAAVQDTWTNPRGAFAMLESASAAYRLLGAEGLSATEMPAINQLIDSNLGYFIRPGKHSMTSGDWKIFLDFADKHLR